MADPETPELARDHLTRTAERRERIVVVEYFDRVAFQASDADATVGVDADEKSQ